jgi:hypothetical protein
MPTRGARRYEYTPLREVGELAENKVVNVYGVLQQASEPAQARAGDRDFFVTAHIADSSLDREDARSGEGVEVRFFGASAKDVPQPSRERQHDIVRIHRGRVVFYHANKPQIIVSTKPVGRLPPASWLLFSRSASDDSPYLTSTPSYTVEREDSKELHLLSALRQFASSCLPAEPPSEHQTLSRCKPPLPRATVDCVIICSEQRQPPGCVTLWVWDATDAVIPTSRWSQSEYAPLHFPMATAGASFELDGLGERVPSLGSIVPAIVSGSHSAIEGVPPDGSNIRLKDVSPRAAGRQVHLMLGEDSSIEADIDGSAIDDRALRRYREGETVENDTGDIGLIVRTDTFHRDVALSTLRQVKAHQPPHKARVLARARRWFPNDLSFCVAQCRGANTDQMQAEIRLAVELEVRRL